MVKILVFLHHAPCLFNPNLYDIRMLKGPIIDNIGHFLTLRMFIKLPGSKVVINLSAAQEMALRWEVEIATRTNDFFEQVEFESYLIQMVTSGRRIRRPRTKS